MSLRGLGYRRLLKTARRLWQRSIDVGGPYAVESYETNLEFVIVGVHVTLVEYQLEQGCLHVDVDALKLASLKIRALVTV